MGVNLTNDHMVQVVNLNTFLGVSQQRILKLDSILVHSGTNEVSICPALDTRPDQILSFISYPVLRGR